jgi:hypothetical protein
VAKLGQIAVKLVYCLAGLSKKGHMHQLMQWPGLSPLKKKAGLSKYP